jgi:ATP-binding protein involved in chromosome partitioning
MPPGTGDVQLSLSQMVPVTGAILVSTPQEVAMQDVRKAYAMFDKVRIPLIGVVENMSYFKPDDSDKKYFIFGEGGGKILASKFKTELLAQIPIVAAVREGGDIGRPITVASPTAPTSLAFRELAKRVAQKVAIMAAEGIDPAQIIQIGHFN